MAKRARRSLALFLCLLVTAQATEDERNSGLVCQHEIVESTPDMLSFNTTLSFKPRPTHESLLEMIDAATQTLRIASFYLTMTAEDQFASHPSTKPGRDIMDAIERAVMRGVNLQVVLDGSSRRSMSNEDDVERLSRLGQVKFLNMTRLLKSGVLHSKFLIADNKTFYVGSSNFDWRSYTQIKEIGISFKDCSPLAVDMDKIFRTYMLLSDLGDVPPNLPDDLKTLINVDKPIKVTLGDSIARVFLGAAPPAFNGVKQWTGRTDDIDGLLHILNRARRRVDISVMNYSARTEFIWPKKYWPRIDNALREAASERGVQVRLMFSNWTHNKPEELMWYRSLNAIQSKSLKGGIKVKLFKVPAYDDFQKSIPYARVKHDKYMVTDRGLFIGTSNWAPDYFINTCGVGVVIEPDFSDKSSTSENLSIVKNMQDLFDRDFNSIYAEDLSSSPERK